MRSRIICEVFWSIVFLALAAAVMTLGALVARGEEQQAVLLDFYADWCGPCKAMTATVDRLAAAGYHVRRVNVDREPGVAARYHVARLPCFVSVAGGREVDRVVGMTSYERLRRLLGRPAEVEVRVGPVGGPHASRPHAEREEYNAEREKYKAWRYERPVGHRAAVVRVCCTTGDNGRSIGSGVLVRWRKRLLVLTARHVVNGAKRVWIETHSKKTHAVRVLKVDATWDCAVLEPAGAVSEIAPAEMEYGVEAMQTAGSRLESCGYGPDGKLACNAGVFEGYRRSTETPAGPDDWMVISGPARSGDSGGPIFNAAGHVVGVLWGSDGQNVVGVQAGRVQRLLEEAVAASKGEGGGGKGEECKLQNAPLPSEWAPLPPVPMIPRGIVERRPTPSDGTRAGQDCLRRPRDGKKTPPPAPTVPSDPETHRVLTDIDAKIALLIEQRQPKPADEAKHEPSPLIAGLCIVGAVVVGFVVYFATQSRS
jgi:S1-C subfamily serine protease